ncbi:MAG: apolipoprotein A1/A4/E family protein [Cyclobacteriaceae bacterium]|nr:apolipoprotein A1/A4/E family protein [Cyclobacteriaceae bacterium]
MTKNLVLLLYILLFAKASFAQDSLASSSLISKKYLDVVSSSSGKISRQMDKKAEKTLTKFRKQEEKLIRKLSKVDSVAAKQMMTEARARYKELEERMKGNAIKQYIPQVDSLATSLAFLTVNPQFLKDAKEVKDKLAEAMGKMDELKSQLHKAEEIKAFLKERKEYLKQQLGQLGMLKDLKKINKQVYYYAQQVNEYKEALKDPKKAGKKALELLAKNGKFRDFMRKNSQLASLFRMPGDPDDAGNMVSLAGLQTRAQVNSLIQQQIAAGGPNAQAQLQQNLQAAQGHLNQLKDKVIKMGGGSSDAEMPEDFKPRNLKVKSFWNRVEIGTNIQSVRSNGILPTTSDLAISAGYLLSENSVVGIGASYKLGWGQNIQNIRISHQGVGARSFIDWKLKGAWWISGGFEMNYRPDLSGLTIPSPFGGSRMGAAWQQSGLIGMSRKIPIKTKFFKNTKAMLLLDFLSYRQQPRTQPVLFRVGFNF